MGAGGLYAWERGAAPPTVLLIHETGATSQVWEPLASALEGFARVVGYDRPGWGASPAPQGYARTTIGEQSTHGAAALASADDGAGARGGGAVVVGAGLGAVVAIELAVNRAELVAGVVAIEPPLLAFLPSATEQHSADAEAIRDAAQRAGRGAVLDLYRAGALLALGPGAERLPPGARDDGPYAATALLAELGAVPGWELPTSELAALAAPVAIVTCAGTPPMLRDAVAGLAATMPRAESHRLDSPGLPHHEGATDLAELILALG